MNDIKYKFVWNKNVNIERNSVKNNNIKNEYTDFVKNEIKKNKQLKKIFDGKIEKYDIIFKNKKFTFYVYKIKKNKSLYKASVQLYDKEHQKKVVFKDLLWFGSLKRAFVFFKTILPGIHSFKIKKDIIVLDLFRYNNLQTVIDILKLQDKNEEVNKIKSFFGYKMSLDNIVKNRVKNKLLPNIYKNKDNTYVLWGYSKNFVKEKFVNDINNYEIIDNIQIYTFYKKNFTNNHSKIMKLIFKVLIQFNIYGTYSPNFYSPTTGIFYEELIIYEPKKYIKRDFNNIYDWTNHRESFPKVTKDFLLLSYNDKSGRALFDTNFYLNNIKKYKTFKSLPKKGYRIMTSNVHNFISVNEHDNVKETMDNFIKMLEKYDIDIVSLQEASINEKTYTWNEYKNKLNEIGFKYSYRFPAEFYQKDINKKFYGFMLFSKYKIKIKKVINLPKPYIRNMRKAILFKFNNILFATTHLEIGYRKPLEEEKRKNIKTRLQQFIEIAKYKPDVIFGDLNFNRKEKEYGIITKTFNDYGNPKEYTTPFNTTTDYFLFGNKIKPKQTSVVPYPYSDHNFLYTDI